ncbi:unnamed protein product, partial [Phaeothamnion confervicola]
SEAQALSRPETAGPVAAGSIVRPDAGESPTATPEELPRAVAPAGFDARTSTEDPTGRSAFETLYINADGSHTVVASSDAVHYSDSEGQWQPIDSTLVVGDDGTIRNRANSWSVAFSDISVDGVSFTTDRGDVLRWKAIEGHTAKPRIERDGVSVRYHDVWPGVDIVYTVRGVGVEELIEITRPDADVSSLAFEIGDARVEQRSDASGLVISVGESKLYVAAPETYDATGFLVDAEGNVTQIAHDGTVGVSIDRDWVKRQPSDRFPITIDPTLTGLATTVVTSFPTPGQGYTAINDGFGRVGNPTVAGKPNLRWRGNIGWNYTSYLGYRVTNATVTSTVASGSATGNRNYDVYWADEYGYHASAVPRTLPPPYPNGNGWTPYGSAVMGNAGTASNVNLTPLFDYWFRNSIAGGLLLFKGDETAALYTVKKYSTTLSVTYNVPPSAPTASG